MAPPETPAFRIVPPISSLALPKLPLFRILPP